MLEWLYDQLQNNDVFAGLAGLSVIGPMLYLLRSTPSAIWDLVKRQFSVHLVVFSDDPLYERMAEWLTEQPYAKKARRLRLRGGDNQDGTVERDEDQEVRRMLVPGEGRHFLQYEKKWMILDCSKEDAPSTGGGMGFQPRESFTIIMPGRSQDGLRRIVDGLSKPPDRETFALYLWDNYWMRGRRRMKRPLNTVILPDNQMQGLVKDMEQFFTSAQIYQTRGIPYRRGYLFSGPPGTGKTSAVVALAGHLDLDVYIVNLATLTDDDKLLSAFCEAPSRSILLIEDIDAMNRGQKTESKSDEKPLSLLGVTLSGLLNTIDGVASPEGRITIMTTNYPDRLDDALLRPGRVDRHERFGLFGSKEVSRMITIAYGNGKIEMDNIPRAVTPAELQGIIMGASDQDSAIEIVKQLT